MKTAFVDFYTKYNVSPVSQDISDLGKHFQRRDVLLRSLGIPSVLVRNAEILEFGPGSGHNSTYIASLKPAKYYLVDGNLKGVKDTKELLSEYDIDDLKVIHSLFLKYQSNSLFDIVWAEGCIPHQNDPINILKHLSSFTAKNGIFVASTNNSISYLSEMIRRIASFMHLNDNDLFQDKIDTIRPLLKGHLQNLKGMSRPVDDWIIDSILQPLHQSKLFSIPDAIETLKKDYDIYSTSPKFISDWRWYKEVIGDGKEFNQLALECYYKNNLNLIDYRYEFKSHSAEFGQKLETLCSEIWDTMCLIQNGKSSKINIFIEKVNDVSKLIKKKAPETSRAIVESLHWLECGAPISKELEYLPKWWGRGQQYVSFIKK
jgi:SAM-dependent methyltransferase